MKHSSSMAHALAFALAALPTASAFCLGHRDHLISSQWTKTNEFAALFLIRRETGGYSAMPPLSNENYTLAGGNIFKVLKRDIYPTVDLPYESNYTTIDHYFMGMALQQAKRAWDKGEVPIGALIVKECNIDDECTTDEMEEPVQQTKREFQILSAAHNRVETNIDASAHAELLALRRGALNLKNWRFPSNSRLYTTLEPCPMCLASIQAFRIDHIVYGAPDNRLGAIKTHIDLMSVAKHPYHEVKSVTGGVREKECGDIMVEFFRERRRKKKEMKEGGRSKLLKLPLKRATVGDTKKKRFGFISLIKDYLRRE